jgi:hypothetical protein
MDLYLWLGEVYRGLVVQVIEAAAATLGLGLAVVGGG